MAKTETLNAKPITRLDPTVRALGIVSLLNDLSSEVAVRTLPLYLANVLGVRTSIIGLIEGVAESTATLLKLASGYLSDSIGKKKAIVLWGYSFRISRSRSCTCNILDCGSSCPFSGSGR